jgi:hypothetical protein
MINTHGYGGLLMLVLTRKINESLVMGNDIFITVTAVVNGESPCIDMGVDLRASLAISLPDIDLALALAPKGDECKKSETKYCQLL